MRIAWVLGWAISPRAFAERVEATLPNEAHVYFPPTAATVDELTAAGPFDQIVGYSLGSLILLRSAERVSQLGPVSLLAPILAFPSEEALGGRISRTQLRYLIRWLARDPAAALGDFYQRAGLSGGALSSRAFNPPALNEFSPDDLRWGLDQLVTARVEPPLPMKWRGWCGVNDALLDAARLHDLDRNIAIVANATHHPGALVETWAQAAK